MSDSDLIHLVGRRIQVDLGIPGNIHSKLYTSVYYRGVVKSVHGMIIELTDVSGCNVHHESLHNPGDQGINFASVFFIGYTIL